MSKQLQGAEWLHADGRSPRKWQSWACAQAVRVAGLTLSAQTVAGSRHCTGEWSGEWPGRAGAHYLASPKLLATFSAKFTFRSKAQNPTTSF